MKLTLLVGIGLITSSVANAQALQFPIKIHNHPQCQYYVAADTPIDPGVTCHIPVIPISDQCHWKVDGVLGHTHNESWPPMWGEVSTSFTIPIQFQLYKVPSGSITRVEGAYLKSITYDNGTLLPSGATLFSGFATYDPFVRDANGNLAPDKGWYEPSLITKTTFNNGTETKNELWFPLYSNRNPLAEETVPNFFISARCTGDPVDVWGTHTSEFRDTYLPILAPIDTTWTSTVLAYDYGGQVVLPDGKFEQRLDMHLHDGDNGTLLSSETSPTGNPNGNVIEINPAVTGTGDHLMAIIWDKKVDVQETTSLLVFPITVGVAPPVTTCQDKSANNFGGPLPCTYDPPTPVKIQVNPTFWRFPNNILQVCDGNACLDLGTLIPQ